MKWEGLMLFQHFNFLRNENSSWWFWECDEMGDFGSVWIVPSRIVDWWIYVCLENVVWVNIGDFVCKLG